jgi:hypothetical protein
MQSVFFFFFLLYFDPLLHGTTIHRYNVISGTTHACRFLLWLRLSGSVVVDCGESDQSARNLSAACILHSPITMVYTIVYASSYWTTARRIVSCSGFGCASPTLQFQFDVHVIRTHSSHGYVPLYAIIIREN